MSRPLSVLQAPMILGKQLFRKRITEICFVCGSYYSLPPRPWPIAKGREKAIIGKFNFLEILQIRTWSSDTEHLHYQWYLSNMHFLET
jgi:hypothetical protein